MTMVSYTIIHRQGVDRYLRESAAAGFDGLIVPDLPVEEAEGLLQAGDPARREADPARDADHRASGHIEMARTTTGFLYYVSVAGITGERKTSPAELAENVAWLRTRPSCPSASGSGSASPNMSGQLAPVADGLIVGSAWSRDWPTWRTAPAPRSSQEIGRFIGGWRGAWRRPVRWRARPGSDFILAQWARADPTGVDDMLLKDRGEGSRPSGSPWTRKACSMSPPVCSNHQARSLRSAWPEKPSRT